MYFIFTIRLKDNAYSDLSQYTNKLEDLELNAFSDGK